MNTQSKSLISALALVLCVGCNSGTEADGTALGDETSTATDETTTDSIDDTVVDETQTDDPDTTDETDPSDESDQSTDASEDDDPDTTAETFSQCGCGDSSQESAAQAVVSCIETLAESCGSGGAGMWQDFGSSYVTIVGWSDDEAACVFEFFAETEGAAFGYTCSFDSEQGFPSASIGEEGWGDTATLDAYGCELIDSCNQLANDDCLSNLNSCLGAG